MKTTPFLIRVLVCLLLSLIPFQDAENWVYSKRMLLRLPQDPSPKILLIYWSTEEWNALKRLWTPHVRSQALPFESLRDHYFWDPTIFRTLLEWVLSKKPAGIAISWFIPKEVIETAPPPEALIGTPFREPIVFWSSHYGPEGKLELPSNTLTFWNNSGFNNSFSDPDGQVRRAYRFREGVPSLAQQLSQQSTKQPSEFLINYASPGRHFQKCSVRELLVPSPNTPCADLKGKYILFEKEGDRSSGSPTQLSTPVDELTRAEVLANELGTLIERDEITQASFLAIALLQLSMIFFAAFFIISYPVVLSAIAICFTGILTVIIVSQGLFSILGIYIPTVNISLSLLVAYLVFTGYRLAFQENIQWRALKQAQYLRELDQMRGNFLSLASHDLKTPIAKIQAVVERIRRELQAPEEQRSDIREHLESIEKSSFELKHTITSMLSLSKIESQKVILNKKNNDINRVAERSRKRFAPLAQSKNITLHAQYEPIFLFEFDEDLMFQVLNNLIDNAIKYSPPGKNIFIRTFENENHVQIEIQDEGPGIPKDQLPLMFRKFSRLVSGSNSAIKGSGLGLYLSKYFIELHGGRIALKTGEGHGTLFRVSLPIDSTPNPR